MFHVTFDGLDEVGNQVVATGQLDVDLGEAVSDAVALVDQSVVNTDCPEHHGDNDREEYQKCGHLPAP